MAYSALKFNGINLYDSYGFVLENKVIPAPRIRRATATRPGVDGVLDFGGVYEEREIIIRGAMLNALDHDDVVENIRELASAIGAVPLGRQMAPFSGQPLSVTSVHGTLEFEDIPNIVFHVIWNGTFDVAFAGRSGSAEVAIVTIGFRQPNPWASSTVDFYYEGQSDEEEGRFWALNENGIYAPPTLLFTSLGNLTGVEITNQGVDPLNTRAITGTFVGSPLVRSHSNTPTAIVGGFAFTDGATAITYPTAGNFSQDHGTVELLYTPEIVPSSFTTTLWTLFVDTSNYWQCWYDSATNSFKFTMVVGGSGVTIDSGRGYSFSNTIHRITVSWDESGVYMAVDGNTRVSGSKVKIAYPSTIRFGSWGNNTLPARGCLDEIIIWNRDVGQAYDTAAWNSRRVTAFGRPVPGVLLYAPLDFSPHATGCGHKVFTYVGAFSIFDKLFVDMGKRTVNLWDEGDLTYTNVIQNIQNGFFDIMPGINTLLVTKTGADEVHVEINFVKRYLL